MLPQMPEFSDRLHPNYASVFGMILPMSRGGYLRFTDTYLQVSKRNLYCWRMAGLVPYFKIGRAVRFRKSDLDAALKRMRIG